MKKYLITALLVMLVLSGCNAAEDKKEAAKSDAADKSAQTAAGEAAKDAAELKNDDKKTEKKQIEIPEDTKKQVQDFIKHYNEKVDLVRAKNKTKVEAIKESDIQEVNDEYGLSQKLFISEEFAKESSYSIIANYQDNGSLKGYAISIKGNNIEDDGIMKMDTGLEAAQIIALSLGLNDEKFIEAVNKTIDETNSKRADGVEYDDGKYKVSVSATLALSSFVVHFVPLDEKAVQ